LQLLADRVSKPLHKQINDIEVVLPNQRPAPMPAIVYGDVKSAKRDLRYIVENLIEYVNRGYKVVCSEPSAALCLREDLALFDDGQDAKKVSDNTYELMEYLSKLDGEGKLKMPDVKINTSYVYHQPCHLWALKSENKSTELLKKLCGAKIETPDTSCCGLAGTCGMQNKNFALSIEIGKDMAAKINKSKADFGLTECAACKMQMEQMTGKITVHPAKVLAKAYNLL
jgi:Fe-S oxidoreductase